MLTGRDQATLATHWHCKGTILYSPGAGGAFQPEPILVAIEPVNRVSY